MGHVLQPEPISEAEARFDEWHPDVKEFLEAWCLIELHGLAGYVALESDGVEPVVLHPVFVEALQYFTAELQRLEHVTRVEEVNRQREKKREAELSAKHRG